MIIVEGPDGCGKTTLVKELLLRLSVNLAPKAVTPEMKSTVHIPDYIDEQLAQGFGPRLYDRFAMVSAPIYGLIFRSGPNEMFWNGDWLAQRESMFQAIKPVIIYCLPMIDTYLDILSSTPQPELVRRNAMGIYGAYWGRAHRELTNGRTFIYDFEQHHSVQVVDFTSHALDEEGL